MISSKIPNMIKIIATKQNKGAPKNGSSFFIQKAYIIKTKATTNS